ncbi:MGH1-like glycoside hydrolase domain-containing protein [Streptomyces sedi]|uniref:Mannosylglycerate hydrolase MGH1-like glycoside hydrolase domain-containing protein n=1 Tax=Streptomyces sedi TaxID=555059 RepID=A0A5C4VF82_9ACTN|nr:trehalase family glycosidase [Streptomyces sedi]TNM34255.1 hypothetical protein FH715_00730 [Streptomyces sedi]
MDRADQSTSPHTTAYNGARRVLTGNWVGASTVPSRSLYPHQWSWDSAFIAIGLRHLWPLRAQRELETLLAAQWDDGRVPHIVFNPSVPLAAYFPSPDFWRSSSAGTACGAPRATETSGLVQPPVHALAAWLVHRADPVSSRQRGFLRRMYPRLVAWQRYLTGARDLGGHGLASIVHPWESGMDNSPCWDPPLSRIEPVGSDTFHRADLDHGRADDRPTDLDYGRYVRLAENYRDHGYRDHDCGHPFAVEDPGVNALLVLSEYALAEIAGALGRDPADHLVRVEELTNALVKRLWDEESGLFLPFDVIAGETVREHSAAGLIPLVLPGLPERTARALVRTARGPRFGLGDTTRMVPSYDLTGHAHDPSRYWRGPAWFNVNWLVERGLRRHGELSLANGLRAELIHLAARSRYAEYVDPVSGEARGTRDFSWTAAVTIDLLTGGPSAAALPAEGRRIAVAVD